MYFSNAAVGPFLISSHTSLYLEFALGSIHFLFSKTPIKHIFLNN